MLVSFYLATGGGNWAGPGLRRGTSHRAGPSRSELGLNRSFVCPSSDRVRDGPARWAVPAQPGLSHLAGLSQFPAGLSHLVGLSRFGLGCSLGRPARVPPLSAQLKTTWRYAYITTYPIRVEQSTPQPNWDNPAKLGQPTHVGRPTSRGTSQPPGASHERVG